MKREWRVVSIKLSFLANSNETRVASCPFNRNERLPEAYSFFNCCPLLSGVQPVCHHVFQSAKMERSSSISKKLIARADWEQNLSKAVISKYDMNKLIMNFLITNDHVIAAEKFMEESGTEPVSDLGKADVRILARKAVQNGNALEAIWKVNDMNPEILKTNLQLFFHLQQQRFIELIHEGKVEEALELSQKELAPRGQKNPEFLEELERTMSLLAFDNPSNCPVQDLYSDSQRQKTATELNTAILISQGLEKDPKLVHVLKLLVWAQNQLHKRAFYPHITDFENATLEDPVLDSRLVCGEEMPRWSFSR